ncbi:MAG: sensor histidine kinase, partial [Acidobacteriota bacterium]
ATIGMLAAGVAHEINNPLAAISGFAEGIMRRIPKLRQGETDPLEAVEDYLDTILRECERCQDIVHSLLTFSRPVSAGFSPLSLNDIVADTLKLLNSHLKNKDRRFTLHTELAYDLPLIYGDEPQLKQVLLNLLTNAMDALENEDGRSTEDNLITIRTYADGQEGAGLVVSDSGCGIPTENLDKLFEPFFTTKPVGKGVGIGLSTCYGIVKEHCGEILVFSEQGKGSRFIVRLPANPEANCE